MTPEGKVKQAIKAYLNLINAYYFMPVQTGYGMTTLDFLGCWRGRFFAIEAKAKGRKPQPRQNLVIADMRSKGGIVLVIDDADTVADMCREYGLG